ncbi:MAG TPA: S-layer homology domain-containing protein [Firmicutes bacterium]|nr:S-layer homology domain-containing protein [Bacillota bacterium]
MAKRLLVVLLAVAMIVSYAGMAAAKFSDTTGNKQESAIGRVASLELVKGYPDGTFKPDGSITRAEFATVMCRALGLEEAAQIMAGQPTSFSDVPANHWATGYINVAASQRIVAGYPDGTFRPDAPVTYAEALKMILCALGYNTDVLRNAIWPITWIAKASELGVTGGVSLASGAASLPATRGDVARMVDNSLAIPKIVQVGYGDEVKYEKDENKTFLADLGYTKVSGRVVDIALTDSDLKDNQLKIGSEKYTAPEGTAPVALLGLEVKGWADGDKNLAYVEVETPSENILYDSVADVPANGVKLQVKDKTYDWASGATKLVNFGSDAVAVGQYGRFVLDDKGKVAFACLFKFDADKTAGLVTEASDTKVKYLSAASAKELKLSKFDTVTVFSSKLDGLKVADIKADSVLYGWVDGDDLYLIVAGDKKEGDLEAVRTSEVTVDGKSYSLGGTKTYSEDGDDTVNEITNATTNLENLLGETVAAILDINGEVRHIRGSVTGVGGWQFGIALKGATEGFDSPARVKILTKDGKVTTYDLETAGDLVGGDFDTNKPVAFRLNGDGEIADGQLKLDLAAIDSMEGYGYVSKAADTAVEIDKGDKAIKVDGKWYYVTGSSALFNQAIKTDDNKDVSDSKVATVAWADIEDKNLTAPGFTVVYKGGDVVLLYFDSGFASVATESLYGVVLGNPWLTSDGWKVKIDVFGEGEKEYVAKSDLTDAELLEGKAVTFTLDAAGKINTAVPETVAKTVYAVSGSYVAFTDAESTWYRVADGAVLYQLDSDNKIDGTISVSDLEKNDNVYRVLDDKGKVVALVRGAAGAPGASEKPVFKGVAALGDYDKVTLQFSEKVKATVALETSDFAASIAGVPVNVTAVTQPDAAGATAFSLTLEKAPRVGQTVEVTIKKSGAEKIVDLDTPANKLGEADITKSTTAQ